MIIKIKRPPALAPAIIGIGRPTSVTSVGGVGGVPLVVTTYIMYIDHQPYLSEIAT